MAEPSMPKAISDWMNTQMWGVHHLVWHLARMWDLVGAQGRAYVQNNGGSRASRQEGEKGNGLDFLAMHRVMIRQLKQNFPADAALFDGWPQPPTDPDDTNEPMPNNGRPRQFSPDMQAAINRLHNDIAGFQTDDELGLYIQTRLRPLQGQPDHLSPDASTGIHNYLHNRFSDNSSNITMGNPLVNIHNKRFWRLHGWIDSRWSAFRQAKGLSEADAAYQQALTEAASHMQHHHMFLTNLNVDALDSAAKEIPKVAENFFAFVAERNEGPRLSMTNISSVSLDAKLWCPDDVYVNLMPPVPNNVVVSFQVSAFLTNLSGITETLFAPTPCDVHFWELRDSSGNLIQSEPPEICTDVVVTLPLGAGETIRGDNVINLNGKLLKDGERYTLKYQFWRQACEADFTAHLLF